MPIARHVVELAASAAPARVQEVHLFPVGEWTGKDGRGPYRLPDPAAVIEATRREAGSTKIAVDFEHATDLAAPKGLPAPAAGWIKALQARADGIWAIVEWTEPAFELIKTKAYRYFSPAFRHRADGRITSIVGGGLTNRPNFELTALAQQENTMDEFMTELRQLLGLDDAADQAAVVTAVREMREAKAEVDLSKWVPIGEFVKTAAELARVNRGVSIATATNRVDQAIATGKLPPFLRDWGISLATQNAPALDDFLAKTSGGLAGLFGELVPGHRPNSTAGGLSEDEAAVAARLGLTADQFKQGARA